MKETTSTFAVNSTSSFTYSPEFVKPDLVAVNSADNNFLFSHMDSIGYYTDFELGRWKGKSV